jgi:hypothetical protein
MIRVRSRQQAATACRVTRKGWQWTFDQSPGRLACVGHEPETPDEGAQKEDHGDGLSFFEQYIMLLESIGLDLL